jgi:PAS domain S-box-containing protein
MRDYGTKNVEPVWVVPLRRYAPAALVLCVAILLAIVIIVPMHSAGTPPTLTTKLILLLVYSALGAVAAFLFIEARNEETTQKSELESAEELYVLSERLNTTLRSIGDGVISTDVDGGVTLLNDVALQLTGLPLAKALGMRAADLFRVINEQTREPVEDPSKRVLNTGKRIREEAHVILVGRDGSERPIAYNAAPILDADGWIMGAVIVFQDVTELRRVQREREKLIHELSETNGKLRDEIQKREAARRAALSLMQDAQTAQAALKESNSALEEYARVASHDLQEPLRKIESFAQVLVEDFGSKLDKQAKVYLDIMVDAANRMRRLIRDVLAFSRAGTVEKPFEAVDLNQVMTIAKDNLSARIKDQHAEVIVGPLPTVFADETQMIQLFQNLAGNGLKFNKSEHPKVEVSAEESRDEWKIFVKDNGIGLRESERQMIFAPFKRLHTQQEFEGTGIGLAICRRIVTRHGGEIGVTAEPGKGSTFWLTMPKSTRQLQEKTTNKASDTKKGDIHEPRTS